METRTTTIVDKNAPGGVRTMELPVDFVERVECKANDPIEPFLARYSPLTAHAYWVYIHAPGRATNTNKNDENSRTSSSNNNRRMEDGIVFGASSRGVGPTDRIAKCPFC